MFQQYFFLQVLNRTLSSILDQSQPLYQAILKDEIIRVCHNPFFLDLSFMVYYRLEVANPKAQK